MLFIQTYRAFWSREEKLNFIALNRGKSIMATLDQLVTDAATNKTKTDQVLTLLGTIKAQNVDIQKQLAEALANEKLTPDQQAKIDAVAASIEATNAGIDAALAAPTP